MKKIVSMILTLAAALSLCACGGGGSSSGGKKEIGPQPEKMANIYIGNGYTFEYPDMPEVNPEKNGFAIGSSEACIGMGEYSLGPNIRCLDEFRTRLSPCLAEKGLYPLRDGIGAFSIGTVGTITKETINGMTVECIKNGVREAKNFGSPALFYHQFCIYAFEVDGKCVALYATTFGDTKPDDQVVNDLFAKLDEMASTFKLYEAPKK